MREVRHHSTQKGTLMSFSPANAVVWAEIPVVDLAKGIAFYNAVFGYDLQIMEMEPNDIAMLPMPDDESTAGHLYPGKPAPRGEGPTVHLRVPDSLEEASQRCEQAGGTVIAPPIPLPNARFQYIEDPDGNSIGLFQPNES